MINPQSEKLKEHLMEGQFGLEKEMLRLNLQGQMEHSPHPFTEPSIVTDFCENQIEINTNPHHSIEATYEELLRTDTYISQVLAGQDQLTWPFSSPSLILSEDDITPAYTRKSEYDQQYRSYLASRYGKYKMTFSGIHFNFSFSDELLKEAWRQSEEPDYGEFVNRLYLNLAKQSAVYGWLISALCNASPLLDGSYYEKGLQNSTSFTGMASMRNSEFGYWNFFTPVLDYSSAEAYAASILQYCQNRLIKAPSELYYPIRLKPHGKNSLENLHKEGIEHIEFRMIDLNPLAEGGISLLDLRFIHLFIVYMSCQPDFYFSNEMQVLAAQNFKSASHFDLKTSRISWIENDREISVPVFNAAWDLLFKIRDFAKEFAPEYLNDIDYQIKKLKDPNKYRYSWIVRRLYCDNYVGRGIELAKEKQEQALRKAFLNPADLDTAE